ncbi:MAG: hypothetical protein LBB90_01675 [Tannerella sp.]|jgi:hypothetical protein|nr:hypothetical protein [Tannerella sp.]
MEPIIKNFIQPADLISGIVNVLSILVAVFSEGLHVLLDATLLPFAAADPETLPLIAGMFAFCITKSRCPKARKDSSSSLRPPRL